MITEIFEAIADIMLNIASGIYGVSEEVVNALFKKRYIVKEEKKHQEVLSQKIARLTNSLHESSQLMDEIEEDLIKQKRLAEEWEEKADTSKIIVDMHQAEIDAVSKILRSQLKSENKASDKKTLIWNIVFCIAGILGGYLISKLLP